MGGENSKDAKGGDDMGILNTLGDETIDNQPNTSMDGDKEAGTANASATMSSGSKGSGTPSASKNNKRS